MFCLVVCVHFPVEFVARVMGEFVVDSVKCGASGGFFFLARVFLQEAWMNLFLVV